MLVASDGRLRVRFEKTVVSVEDEELALDSLCAVGSARFRFLPTVELISARIDQSVLI